MPSDGPRKNLDRPAAVYRAYNRNAVLLYVGCSWSLKARYDRHRQTKPWWRAEVTRITEQWYPTRTEAEDAESQAIRSELPRYNLQFTSETRREDAGAFYELELPREWLKQAYASQLPLGEIVRRGLIRLAVSKPRCQQCGGDLACPRCYTDENACA